MITKMFNGQEVLMSGASSSTASDILYDNTSSGLSSDKVQDAIDEIVDDKLDMSYISTSGNPISIVTDSEQAAKECIITLEPIQAGSGDPSPSNVRAISGYDKAELSGCGKNLCKEYSSVDTSTTYYPCLQIKANITAGTEICLSFIGDSGFLWYSDTLFDSLVYGTTNGERQHITGVLKTDLSDSELFNAFKTSYGNTHYANFRNVQIELGSTATTYEPYNPITDITLNLPETVYGGTLNVETGELVVDSAIKKFTSSDAWVKGSLLDGTQRFLHIVSPTMKTPDNGVYGIPNIKACNILKITDAEKIENYEVRNLVNSRIDVGLPESLGINTIEKMAQWAVNNNLEVVYPLATPYNIKLTPAQVRLLQGNNVVTTNGTNIQLTYRNGEVATLTDISSIAESVNVLGEQTRELMEHVPNNITSRLGALSTAIAAHNLEKYGYKIGDYFIGVSGYYYYLADLDTFYGGYTAYATVNTHHIGIVVNTKTISKWYETADISNVNYKDSTLHTYLSTTVLNNIKSDLVALFGSWESHLVKHDKLYAKIGTWNWSSNNTQSEYISALTEFQIYGSQLWSADNFQQGEGTKQLELFRRHTTMQVFGNVNTWLRSISTTSKACYMNYSGSMSNNDVTNSNQASGLILLK